MFGVGCSHVIKYCHDLSISLGLECQIHRKNENKDFLDFIIMVFYKQMHEKAGNIHF